MTGQSRGWRVWRHPGTQLAMAVLFVVVTVLSVGTLSHLVFKSSPSGVAELALYTAVAAAFVGMYVLFCRLVERRAPFEFAIRPALPELASGIVFGTAIFACVVAIIAAFGGYRIAGYNGVEVTMPILALSIFSGFSEEIVFRGLLMRLLEKWLGTWAGLAISSLLFGLAHLGNSFVGPIAVIAIIEAGLMLGLIYLLTRRLWMAVAVHGAWNFAQGGIFGIAVSGGAAQGVIQPEISGTTMLTGGAFGAEASLPAVTVLAIVSVVLLGIICRRGQFTPPLWIRNRQGVTAEQE